MTNNQKKNRLVVTIPVLVGLVTIAVPLGFIHRDINVLIDGGGLIHIEPLSYWQAWSGGGCKIVYKQGDGKIDTVFLWQEISERPLIIMPCHDRRMFSCLYDFELPMALLKFDTTRSFKPQTNGWHRVNAIVCSSTCAVDEANINEWLEAYEYLKNLSPEDFRQQGIPAVNWGIVEIGLSRQMKSILQRRMGDDIKYMQDRGLSHLPGDIDRWVETPTK